VPAECALAVEALLSKVPAARLALGNASFSSSEAEVGAGGWLARFARLQAFASLPALPEGLHAFTPPPMHAELERVPSPARPAAAATAATAAAAVAAATAAAAPFVDASSPHGVAKSADLPPAPKGAAPALPGAPASTEPPSARSAPGPLEMAAASLSGAARVFLLAGSGLAASLAPSPSRAHLAEPGSFEEEADAALGTPSAGPLSYLSPQGAAQRNTVFNAAASAASSFRSRASAVSTVLFPALSFPRSTGLFPALSPPSLETLEATEAETVLQEAGSSLVDAMRGRRHSHWR